MNERITMDEKEIDEMTEYVFQRILEIDKYIAEHNSPRELVKKTIAVAVAYLINPPEDTEDIFADSFRDDLLYVLDKVKDVKNKITQ